jgi:hypothetical protein
LVGILAELDLPARALRILESVANAADLPETAIGDMAQLYLTMRPKKDLTFL